MRVLRGFFEVVVEAALSWSKDKVSLFAAAIAFYTIFSLTPLVSLTVALAGLVFGPAAAEGEIVEQISQFLQPEAAILVQDLLETALDSASGVTVISIAIVLFGASGVFNQTKRALDVIFGVLPQADNGLRGLLEYAKTRALTFLMVFVMGFLLIGALALNTIVGIFNDLLLQWIPRLSPLLPSVSLIISPIIMLIFFSVLFKTLPDIRIAWRDVWLGALMTTGLFLLGNYLITFYLFRTGSVASVYGATSSLIVILLWIYYSAQIVLYGAEFTKVYARRFGRGILPSDSAIFIAERYVEEMPEMDKVWRFDEPEQMQPELIFPESAETPPAPSSSGRKAVAAGLMGLASGLFLGFLASVFRDD